MFSGCEDPIAEKSFVCHSTPHFDSTSREVSYSVRAYHTRYMEKSKYPFAKTVKFQLGALVNLSCHCAFPHAVIPSVVEESTQYPNC